MKNKLKKVFGWLTNTMSGVFVSTMVSVFLFLMILNINIT